MRTKGWLLALALAGGTACAAQTNELVLWRVLPATAADRARAEAIRETAARRLPTTVQESTAGSFGQPSSDMGQTSGSYGTAAGSFGTAASNTGKNAGDHGQTSGSFGHAASDHGQNAGSYGTAAGNFGQTASTYGQNSSDAGQAPAVAASTARPKSHDAVDIRIQSNALTWARTADAVRAGGDHGDVGVRVVDVVSTELKESLDKAAGTQEYPDLLMGAALPSFVYNGRYGLAMLGLPNVLDAPVSKLNDDWRTEQMAIMAHAPHLLLAQSFVVWAHDGGECSGCGVEHWPQPAREPARLAVSAVDNILNGATLASLADTDAAKFSGPLAARLALMPPSTGTGDLKTHFDVTSVDSNDRLAVVTVRAVVSSSTAFGVTDALVVLRKDERAHWKVLQVSANTWPRTWTAGDGSLAAFARAHAAAKVIGVSLAAPVDGDVRPPQPELWWDNGGGAGLQIVEWQIQLGDWTDTRLMPVPDLDPRLQTRVQATFARVPGDYRWRVWSVGDGGVLVLSPWRTFTVVK